VKGTTVLSPFDDRGDEPSHLLLANEAGDRCVWPAFAEVPAGWRTVLPASPHRTCLAALRQPAPSLHPSQGDAQ
jgi:MbtH protein